MAETVEERTGVLHSGVSRRTVLKGAAVAGGALWVAPVIESFPSVAAAASAVTPQTVYYLSGTTTISWLALVVQVGSGSGATYYLAKINPGKTPLLQWYDGSGPSFPCGGSSTWPIPTSPYITPTTGPSPSPLKVVEASSNSVTVTVTSGDSIVIEEQHGGNSNGTGSTCYGSGSSTSPLDLTGTITFTFS